MALTDTAIRNAKPSAKPYKLADEKGLYLLVNAAGKYWRLDYRFDGKRKTLSLGVYPDYKGFPVHATTTLNFFQRILISVCVPVPLCFLLTTCRLSVIDARR